VLESTFFDERLSFPVLNSPQVSNSRHFLFYHRSQGDELPKGHVIKNYYLKAPLSYRQPRAGTDKALPAFREINTVFKRTISQLIVSGFC